MSAANDSLLDASSDILEFRFSNEEVFLEMSDCESLASSSECDSESICSDDELPFFLLPGAVQRSYYRAWSESGKKKIVEREDELPTVCWAPSDDLEYSDAGDLGKSFEYVAVDVPGVPAGVDCADRDSYHAVWMGLDEEDLTDAMSLALPSPVVVQVATSSAQCSPLENSQRPLFDSKCTAFAAVVVSGFFLLNVFLMTVFLDYA